MDVPPVERYRDCSNDIYPLLMERGESHNEHMVNMRSTADSPSPLHRDESSSGTEAVENQDRLIGSASTRTRAPVSQSLMPSGGGLNVRNSSAGRRGDARRRQNPLNSGLWISVELALTMSQIVASIVVLSVSRHEHPRAPLLLWIVGYATGCFATLPLLYWRYHNRNQVTEHDANQSRSSTAQISVPAGPFSVSVSRSSDGDDRHAAVASPRTSQRAGALNARLKALIDYFKMGLDCFFAVWFVVGNVWIFGGRSSANDAPNMYRLCIVFLTFSCIGYAMPFILCATICCCLPCIISILGFREDLSRTRGATDEAIHALPTYKFKLKKSRNENDVENPSAGEGGVIAAGTERERNISGEDAVCCICLAKYVNNDEVKELSCNHFFHKECVDKWLKINALCPLCKSEVGITTTLSDASSANS